MKFLIRLLIAASLLTSAVAQSATTVIFEAGFGGQATVWDSVVELLPDSLTVITYTRPSLREDGIGPSSIDQDVEHLISLVKVARKTGKVILVGHSYGGLLVTEAVTRRGYNVDGVVLIDPTTRAQRARFKQFDAERVKSDDELLTQYLPEELLPQYIKLVEQLDTFEDDSIVPLPAELPTVLITSTQRHKQPMFFEETEEGKRIWLALHNELFANVVNGRHIRSSAVGHNIPLERPKMVVESITSLVSSSL